MANAICIRISIAFCIVCFGVAFAAAAVAIAVVVGVAIVVVTVAVVYLSPHTAAFVRVL